MSRKPPEKLPSKLNVICSVTSSAPFGSTWIRTFEAGSESTWRARPGDREHTEQGGRGDDRPAQNLTCGASRAGSSISKKSFGANRKVPATRFVGTVWVALL